MSSPLLFALCGAIGSGKDTVADHLQARHSFCPVSFAKPLKDIAAQVYDLTGEQVFGSQESKSRPLDHVRDADGNPRTPRQILELLGTEGFRLVDPDTWVKMGMRRVRNLLSSGRSVVITDTRFANEFEAVKRAGGKIIRVEKVGGPPAQRTGHASDLEWERVYPDYVLVADAGDLGTLYQRATDYVYALRDAQRV